MTHNSSENITEDREPKNESENNWQRQLSIRSDHKVISVQYIYGEDFYFLLDWQTVGDAYPHRTY